MQYLIPYKIWNFFIFFFYKTIINFSKATCYFFAAAVEVVLARPYTVVEMRLLINLSAFISLVRRRKKKIRVLHCGGFDVQTTANMISIKVRIQGQKIEIVQNLKREKFIFQMNFGKFAVIGFVSFLLSDLYVFYL